MAKFKFRLQRVLDVRDKEEDIKKNFYSESKQQLEQEAKKLENLNRQQVNTRLAKNLLAQSESLRVKELLSYDGFISSLSNRIEAQTAVVEAAEESVKLARLQLLEATKDKKILENLRLKDFEAYNQELKHEEEKLTDQFVSYSSSKNTLED